MFNKNPYLKLMLIIILVIGFGFLISCKQDSASKLKTKPGKESPTPDEYKEPVETAPQSDDRPTLKYTYRFIDSTDIPPVSIVIDDFGQIGGDLLQGYAELDESITFAVLPDLPNTEKTAKLANIYGHEVILHIPMQAQDTSQNPGKTFIKTGMDKSQVKDIIKGFLQQVPQAVGANNHMGSGVTSDYNTIYYVMDFLDSKGLFFLDSKTTTHSKVAAAAKELRADYAARDIFLDVPDVSNATMNAKLKELEKYKGRVEPVIIISHCHNQAKLVAMRSFITQLKAMGIRLIPLSDAVNKFVIPS